MRQHPTFFGEVAVCLGFLSFDEFTSTGLLYLTMLCPPDSMMTDATHDQSRSSACGRQL